MYTNSMYTYNMYMYINNNIYSIKQLHFNLAANIYPTFFLILMKNLKGTVFHKSVKNSQ